MVNIFYLPGTIIGAFLSDKFGPRYTLAGGVLAQAIVGFIFAGLYGQLDQPKNVAAFAVVYGIFLTLGELGPGNNIGLLASKTCHTGVRGQYYGVAAAMGKIGAFVGVWVFPYIQAAGGTEDDNRYWQYPFYVAACLAILSATLAIFFLPPVDQDSITKEDIQFRAFLEANGYDTTQLGLKSPTESDVSERGAAEQVAEKN